MAKKATHIAVSRSCGIIHGYDRIRNPYLPRFLFGGGMVIGFLARQTIDKDCFHDYRNICGCKITTKAANCCYTIRGKNSETHYDSINIVALSQLFHNGHKCKEEETTKKHHFFVLLTTLAISEFYSVV